MNWLVLLSAGGVAISLAYYIAATIAALGFARRAARAAAPLPKIAPRIAVLKPLHGISGSLIENVVSFLESSYPRVDYIFGVSGYDDRAAEVPVALKPRYQFANIALVVGEQPGAANRKIAKLIKMAEHAPKAEIFVLSDADVAVDRDHLRRVVGELMEGDRVGAATCAYRARPTSSLASRLEALYVNTDFAPMTMLSAAIEPLRHAFGATIAVRREALEAIGGFAALSDLLADDFYLGRMIADHGMIVKLSTSLVTITSEERAFSDFWRHQLRWARTYRTVRPISLATIFTHGLFWALILIWASRLNPLAFAVALMLLAARTSLGALILAKVLRLPEVLGDLWLLPFKDLLMTAIWFASLLGNEVRWGSRRFRILRNGAMVERAS